MPWEISGLVRHESRPGVDASGWLWEMRRGEGDWPGGAEVRRVLVEISGTAGGVDRHHLPSDVAQAITTEGRSEVEQLLELDDPPRLIQCGTMGCRPGQLGDGET